MKKGKKSLDDLLLLCQRGIEDAIYCEDGLDGEIGTDIIKEINRFRKLNGLSKTQQVEELSKKKSKED